MNVMNSDMGVCFIVSEHTKSLVGVQVMHSNSSSTIVKDKLIVTFVLAKVVSDLSGVCLLDLQEYFLQDRGSFDFWIEEKPITSTSDRHIA